MPRAVKTRPQDTKATKKTSLDAASPASAGRKRLFLLSLCLWSGFLPGCGRETPPPPPPAGPEPELPAIGRLEPSEAVRIDEEKFLEIHPPPRPEPLRWDFSPGRRYGYEVSQKLSQVTVVASGNDKAVTRSEDRNGGYFEFVAAGGGTALARVKIQTRSSLIDGKPAPAEAIEKHPPTKFEARIGEDGVHTSGQKLGGASDPLIFLDILLALQEGERESGNGKVLTRITGYFKIERHECARLESEFELAPSLDSGRTLLRGRSVAYFALRERRFVRAEMAIAQAMRSRARTEQGAWVTRSTDLETAVRLRPID